MKDRRHTLSHLLATMPEPEGRWAFLGAVVLPDLDVGWRDALDCEQPERGAYLDLEAAGYAVEAEPDPASQKAGALVMAGRSRTLNEWRIAVAHRMVRPGGTIVVCGAKTDGIASLRKRCAPVVASHAKHHATAFTVHARDDVPVPSMAAQVGRWTIPRGTFSDDGPDAASQLLVPHFERHVVGSVADFGAGWGYLSAHVEGEVDAYEADFRAVAAIGENCANARALWRDVLREPVEGRYDTIVMNPPFHTGRAADPGLGQAFIERAAASLTARGRLLMVANRRLPYEATLDRHFSKVEKLADDGGFKVFKALR